MSEHDVLLFALPSIRQKGPGGPFSVTENRASSTLGVVGAAYFDTWQWFNLSNT